MSGEIFTERPDNLYVESPPNLPKQTNSGFYSPDATTYTKYSPDTTTYATNTEYTVTPWTNSLTTGLFYGFLIALLVVVVWYIWAEFVLKWSNERIGSLMLSKYKLNRSLSNSEPIGDYKHLNYSDVFLDADKKYATCNINVIDNGNKAILNSTFVKYYIVPHCMTNNENIINDLDCIKV